MQTRLLLTDDQVQKLSAIMDETRKLTDDLNKRHQPEYEAIQKSQREKIRALFTPEQLLKYEALRRPPDGKKNKPDGGR
jgi:Spy/CpxP family protein refolding chaperone